MREISLPAQEPIRWSRDQIEGRVRAAFWSAIMKLGKDIDTAWLSYTELRRFTTIGRSAPPDKTFATVLKRLVAAGVLERESIPRRARYRLRLRLTDADVRSAALAYDTQRIEMAATLGHEANLREGWTLYGLPKSAPATLRQEFRSICRDFQDELVKTALEEAERMRRQVVRFLRQKVKPPEVRSIGAFLTWAMTYRVVIGNPPMVAAYAIGLERLVGPEFLEAIIPVLPRVLDRLATKHAVAVRRFLRPAVDVWSSTDAVVRGVAMLFGARAQLTGDEETNLRREMRKRGIPYAKLADLGRRWIVLMQCFSPTLVVSAHVRAKLDSSEWVAAVGEELGRESPSRATA